MLRNSNSSSRIQPRVLTWSCRFASDNVLNLREVNVVAPTLGDCLIKLHDDLKAEFIANNLLEIKLLTVHYE